MADAFQQYCREVREQVKKETPDLGYNDMTKELDKRWNNEEDKTKWEHAAQAYVFRARARAVASRGPAAPPRLASGTASPRRTPPPTS